MSIKILTMKLSQEQLMKYKEVLNVVEIINTLIGSTPVGGEGMKDPSLKAAAKTLPMSHVIKMPLRIQLKSTPKVVMTLLGNIS